MRSSIIFFLTFSKSERVNKWCNFIFTQIILFQKSLLLCSAKQGSLRYAQVLNCQTVNVTSQSWIKSRIFELKLQRNEYFEMSVIPAAFECDFS